MFALNSTIVRIAYFSNNLKSRQQCGGSMISLTDEIMADILLKRFGFTHLQTDIMSQYTSSPISIDCFILLEINSEIKGLYKLDLRNFLVMR